MRAPALGEAATHLSWLSPSAASLGALAKLSGPTVWAEVRADPGAVLLVLRQPAASRTTPNQSLFPSLLYDPGLLETAARHLDHEDGFVDWNLPEVKPIYQASLTYAVRARTIAERTGRCDADNAWVAGLLAPLGWLAMCAVAPDQTAACLADPQLPRHPASVQQSHWGLDQAGIARRLCRRWRLPRWLEIIIGHLDLPAETAQTLGADLDLFRVIQLAISQERHGNALYLGVAAFATECATALGLSAKTLEEGMRDHGRGKTEVGQDFPAPAVSETLADSSSLIPHPSSLSSWQSPRTMPLLREVLLLAAENRRWAESPVLDRLEQDLDHLHRALQDQRAGEESRLHTLKLNALAELAAGAGHEINNPLAVISGQAQYLLTHEPEPSRQRSLQTIIVQAQRIHQILSELMQFARPPRPQPQLMDVAGIIREVMTDLGDLAIRKRVRLDYPLPDHPVYLHIDPRQVRTALGCLVRNAIEAAPEDGWAGVRLETSQPDRLELVVEDNGAGLEGTRPEHLFDPFYSGRQAGRGRGLGLPTAWRLAREHGGDVRFEQLPSGPTRFVLSLPRHTFPNGSGCNGHSEQPLPLPARVEKSG